MKRDIVLLVLGALAVLGSVLAVWQGQGDEPLGVWNQYGPVSKGHVFYLFFVVTLTLVLAPVVNRIGRWRQRRKDARELAAFHRAFADGQARRHPPQNKTDRESE